MRGNWKAAMRGKRLTRGAVTHTRPPELVSHGHRAIPFVRDFYFTHRIGTDATSRSYCVCEPTQNHTMPIRRSHSFVLPSDELTLSPQQLPIFLNILDGYLVGRPVVELGRARALLRRDRLSSVPPLSRYAVIPVARKVWPLAACQGAGRSGGSSTATRHRRTPRSRWSDDRPMDRGLNTVD